MGVGPSGGRGFIVLEPKIKRGSNRGVVDTSFSDDIDIGEGINIRDAKVERIKGTDPEGVKVVVGFNKFVIEWLEFPIVLP
jgi:hypothetical protein